MFDGRARAAAEGFTEDLEDEGAEWALAQIKRGFHTHFKNPTGYYESHVHISNIAGDPVVNDGGTIAYGPWLEGVGSRNNSTRFRGYHTFRKVAMRLERRIEGMGYRLLDRKWLRRME